MDKKLNDKSEDTSEPKLKIEKITGSASNKQACIIFSKRITFSEDEVGVLAGFYQTQNEEASKSHEVAHDLFQILVKRLEEASGDGILENLKAAKVDCEDFSRGSGIEASYAISFFYKRAVYFSKFGNLVKIFAYNAPSALEIKFEDGSGSFSTGQLFILGSSKFFDTFDTSIFSQSADIDLEDVIDGLATDISAQEDQAEIGALFVQVGGEGKGEVDSNEVKAEVVQSVEQLGVDEQDLNAGFPMEEMDALSKRHKVNILSSLGVLVGGGLRFIRRELLGLSRGEAGAVSRIRRNIVVVAAVLLIVLGASGYFTYAKQNDLKKSKEFEGHITVAAASFSEGSAVVELNRSRARDILIGADKEVKLALSIRPKDAEALSLSAQIAQKLKDTENLASVDFRTFYEDSGAVSLGKMGNNIVGFFEDKVVEIDKDGKKMVEVDDLGNIYTGVVFDKSIFTLSGNRVVKTTFEVSKKDEVVSINGALDIGVFLGNVYLLLPSQISKFVPIEGGYSKGADYLEKAEDFSAHSHFAIDGSVWVTKGNQVLKYTRGKKEDFSIQGLTGANSDFYNIYTTSDIDNLYIVDHANSAVLVVAKDGTYKKSYQSQDFSKLTSLMVDEAMGKMYITTGGKILVASL
jgi:hypothetical protein